MLFPDIFQRQGAKGRMIRPGYSFNDGRKSAFPKQSPAKREGPAQGGPARSGSFRFFDELHRIANGHDGFGGVIGDFNAKFFLEGHDEFDAVERVGAEIIDEVSILDHLLGVDAEMLDHDFLYALGDIAHFVLVLAM
jgi:hypothetical protein